MSKATVRGLATAIHDEDTRRAIGSTYSQGEIVALAGESHQEGTLSGIVIFQVQNPIDGSRIDAVASVDGDALLGLRRVGANAGKA
jgi:hypothetical protein